MMMTIELQQAQTLGIIVMVISTSPASRSEVLKLSIGTDTGIQAFIIFSSVSTVMIISKPLNVFHVSAALTS